MKPREFIARIINLFEFDLGPNWTAGRPGDFASAQMQIALARKTPGFDDVRQVISSYLFILESANELGVSTIRASMVPATNTQTPLNQPILEGLRATMCFIVEDSPTLTPAREMECDDHIFESWQLPNNHAERGDEIMGMLAYLILKTNLTVTRKHG